MPKIKVTPKRGEKGFRGPGSKPKPKASKGPGSGSKGRSTTSTRSRQSTIAASATSSASRGRKRAASAREQTQPAAKRQRGREARQMDATPEGVKSESRLNSRSTKGRAVPGRGKGKGKAVVRGEGSRSTKAAVVGSQGASGSASEESDREGGTGMSERASRMTTRGYSADSGRVRGRGAGGGRRGRKRVHVSSDEGENDSPGLEKSQENVTSAGVEEHKLRNRTSRQQGRMERKEHLRESQESCTSDEEGGARLPRQAKSVGGQEGPTKASVREVTIADKSMANWEAISGEANKVMGDAMLSALGRCVEGLNGGRKQCTEQELQRLMTRVEDRLRESKGPKTGRMKTYATAKQSSRALKEKCVELLQRNQAMEERMEERLGSVEEGKVRTDQLKEMVSEQSGQSPPKDVELLEVPLQRSEEEEGDSEEFLEELAGFLQRSRQAELQSRD